MAVGWNGQPVVAGHLGKAGCSLAGDNVYVRGRANRSVPIANNRILMKALGIVLQGLLGWLTLGPTQWAQARNRPPLTT